MKTLLNVLLVLVVAVTLSGCRCINTARTNRCLFCQPTGQCMKEQIRAPADWCWGSCQVNDDQQEPTIYLPPDTMRS